jgi:hypothetical protein
MKALHALTRTLRGRDVIGGIGEAGHCGFNAHGDSFF